MMRVGRGVCGVSRSYGKYRARRVLNDPRFSRYRTGNEGKLAYLSGGSRERRETTRKVLG